MECRKVKGFYWPPDVTDGNIKFCTTRKVGAEWVVENWNRKGVVIQAGGSYGVWPRILAKHFEVVYSFEPEPTSFYFLVRNCPELNVIKFPMALGNTARLVHVKRRGDSSHIVVDGEGVIPMIPIDNLHLPSCDAILLDVESSELLALVGGVDTIMRDKPLILIEDRKDAGTPAQLWLENLGYKHIHTAGGDKVFTHGRD